MRLTDALGREVARQSVAGSETTLPLAAVPQGLYTVQWLDAAGRVLTTRKMARQ